VRGNIDGKIQPAIVATAPHLLFLPALHATRFKKKASCWSLVLLNNKGRRGALKYLQTANDSRLF